VPALPIERNVTPRRTARFAAGVLLLLAAACTFVAPPFVDLAGTWQTDANPTGRGWVLSLHTRGDSVAGFGYRLGLEGHVKDSVSVAGRAQGASVWLRFMPAKGDTSTFTGRIVSSSRLDGMLATAGTPPGTLRLSRE
jgi:hypothetical protein